MDYLDGGGDVFGLQFSLKSFGIYLRHRSMYIQNIFLCNYYIGVLYFQQIKESILKVMYFENIEESSRFILTINISHPNMECSR